MMMEMMIETILEIISARIPAIRIMTMILTIESISYTYYNRIITTVRKL